MKVLIASNGHPTADQIYRKVRKDFPTTSLATVYKTICMMKKMSAVLELEFSQENNRYDGKRPFPHPHVICTQCAKIIDPDSVKLNKMTRKIAAETGFQIVNFRVDFYGICPECQNTGRVKPQAMLSERSKR
jgi:Fur family peroxide stress response transcriptional regulator